MKYLAGLLSLLITFSAMAQKRSFTLKGYLGVSGGESFNYQLAFTDSNSYLTGYSLVWSKEANDIKSTVTGKIDRRNKRISFKETGILYNNNFRSKATICLIEATLKQTSANKGSVLEGPMSSRNLIGLADCSSGTITFINDAVFNELFSEPAPAKDTPAAARPAQPAKPQKVIYATGPLPQPVASRISQPAEPATITEGKDQSITWRSDTLTLDVWDGGKIDGDIISIFYDNARVLTRYTLTREKRQLRIPVYSGTHTITILAENTGNEPPNTANLLLTDGDRSLEFIAHNETGQKAIIRIKKEPQ